MFNLNFYAVLKTLSLFKNLTLSTELLYVFHHFLFRSSINITIESVKNYIRYLFGSKEQYVFDASINYFEVDYSRAFINKIPQHQVIAFANNQDSQSVIVFNSLTSVVRHDIITLVVASENIKVSLLSYIYSMQCFVNTFILYNSFLNYL